MFLSFGFHVTAWSASPSLLLGNLNNVFFDCFEGPCSSLSIPQGSRLSSLFTIVLCWVTGLFLSSDDPQSSSLMMPSLYLYQTHLQCFREYVQNSTGWFHIDALKTPQISHVQNGKLPLTPCTSPSYCSSSIASLQEWHMPILVIIFVRTSYHLIPWLL